MKTLKKKIIKRLKQIFYRLRSVNLKLNSKKCSFLRKEIEYLGYVISEKEVFTDKEKISSVRNWPVPRTKKQIRSFLGFCSYYRKFVKDEFFSYSKAFIFFNREYL